MRSISQWKSFTIDEFNDENSSISLIIVVEREMFVEFEEKSRRRKILSNIFLSNIVEVNFFFFVSLLVDRLSFLHRRFSQFESFPLTQIHSELFLSICDEYFSLFDKCPSPTFIPLRSDIHAQISVRIISLRTKIFRNENENIKENSSKNVHRPEQIRNFGVDHQRRNFNEFDKREKFGDRCFALVEQVNIEMNSPFIPVDRLFLFRNLHFLHQFLFEFGQKTCSVEEAMNKAYGKTLRPFHGWITRGIFSVRFLFLSDLCRSTKIRFVSFRSPFDRFRSTKIFFVRCQTKQIRPTTIFSNNRFFVVVVRFRWH